MNLITIFVFMLFAHIIDDYYLQGILANLKQKSWWESNAEYKDLYRFDYICALIVHSISWATMIILPILYIENFNPDLYIWLIWACNIAIHAFVDDLKANKRKINLCQDQAIHFAQIALTFSLYAIFR